MTEKPSTYDPMEDLSSDQAIADFMAGEFETNDPDFIAHALGVVARLASDHGAGCRSRGARGRSPVLLRSCGVTRRRRARWDLLPGAAALPPQLCRRSTPGFVPQ